MSSASTTTTPNTFVVIPCSGDKAATPAPAGEFYTGTMFVRAMQAATSEAFEGATVLILSAKYGLITTDTVLDPYNVKMGMAGCVDADTVAAQAEALGLGSTDVFALLPKAYFAVLADAVPWAEDVYQDTLGVGDHRKVLRTTIEIS